MPTECLEWGGEGHLLFYVDKKNNVSYKGFIDGKISYPILKPEKSLMDNKLLLCTVTINKEREEEECFFYSWALNRRITAKWSSLDSIKNSCEVQYKLEKYFTFPTEVVDSILEYMQANNAWLATIRVNSKDNTMSLNFVTVIGLDGLPLLDLTYVLPDYSIGTIGLLKERIEEVDEKKAQLEQMMEQRMLEVQKNKENIAASFFRVNALLGETKKESIPENLERDGNRLIMNNNLHLLNEET